jgi:type II secretory pathway component PulC
MLARPDASSSAWIASASGPVRSYRIGDTVAPGATLKSVAVDHVLLDVAGHIERLGFPRKEPAEREPAAEPAIPEGAN